MLQELIRNLQNLQNFRDSLRNGNSVGVATMLQELLPQEQLDDLQQQIAERIEALNLGAREFRVIQLIQTILQKESQTRTPLIQQLLPNLNQMIQELQELTRHIQEEQASGVETEQPDGVLQEWPLAAQGAADQEQRRHAHNRMHGKTLLGALVPAGFQMLGGVVSISIANEYTENEFMRALWTAVGTTIAGTFGAWLGNYLARANKKVIATYIALGAVGIGAPFISLAGESAANTFAIVQHGERITVSILSGVGVILLLLALVGAVYWLVRDRCYKKRDSDED
ncbi:MAG: hypothetical protein LBF68_00010 [Christensenellaceae bacterium]|jgi:hypothetical protein|nr:hypothetical protein [Christensenellaceae bacterium]